MLDEAVVKLCGDILKGDVAKVASKFDKGGYIVDEYLESDVKLALRYLTENTESSKKWSEYQIFLPPSAQKRNFLLISFIWFLDMTPDSESSETAGFDKQKLVKVYSKSDYRIIGPTKHSAVKPCHWQEQKLLTGLVTLHMLP